MKYLATLLKAMAALFIILCSHTDSYASFWKFYPMPHVYAYSISEDSKGNLYMIAYDRDIQSNIGGLYRSTDDGDTWELYGLNFMRSKLWTIFIDKDDIFHIGLFDSCIDDSATYMRSTDYGKTWEIINNGLYNEGTGCYPYTVSLLKKADGTLIANTDAGLIKYNDDKSWEILNVLYFDMERESTIAEDENGAIIISAWDGIYSYDNNQKKLLLTSEKSIETDFQGVVVNSKNHYFATSNAAGTFRSTDRGQTWDSLSYEGYGIIASHIIIDKNDNIYLNDYSYKGEHLVLRSSDEGVTWEDITKDMYDTKSYPFYNMFISKKGYLFLAADGGVYRTTNIVTSAEENNAVVSNSNMLNITYDKQLGMPVIDATLSELGYLNIELINSLGYTVAKIVDEKKETGNYHFDLNQKELTNGMYFCRMNYGNKTEIKKVLILK